MANRDKKNRSFEANRRKFKEFVSENDKKREKPWRKPNKDRRKAEKDEENGSNF